MGEKGGGSSFHQIFAVGFHFNTKACLCSQTHVKVDETERKVRHTEIKKRRKEDKSQGEGGGGEKVNKSGSLLLDVFMTEYLGSALTGGQGIDYERRR